MHKKAFTLIELLVVLAIIGIISGFIFVQFNDATNAAKDAERRTDIANIYTSILSKGIAEGDYPDMSADIKEGSTPTELQAYISSYLPTVPYDPTGTNPYFYVSDGIDFAVGAVLSNGTCFTKSTNSFIFDGTDCAKLIAGGIGSVQDFMVLNGGYTYLLTWAIPSPYSVLSSFTSTALICLTQNESDSSVPSESELFTSGHIIAIINGASQYYYTASDADYKYFCKAVVYDNTVVTSPGSVGSIPNTNEGGFDVPDLTDDSTSNFTVGTPGSGSQTAVSNANDSVPGVDGSTSSEGRTSSSFVVSSGSNANNGTGSITLTWTPGANSTHTIIRRGEASAVDATVAPQSLTDGVEVYNKRNDDGGQTPTAQHTYTDTGLDENKYYCYSAWAYNSDLNVYSNGYVLACSGIPPSDPSNFTISSQVDRFVLAWTKGSGDSTVIRRQTNTPPVSQSQGTLIYNSTANGITDTENLSQNTTYCYSVWSYRTNTETLSNSYASGCGDLNPVGNAGTLTFTNVAYNSMTLTWSKAINSTSTVVVRKENSVPASRTDGVEVYNGEAATFMDTNLTAGNNYCYAVWGTDGTNYSLTPATGCKGTILDAACGTASKTYTYSATSYGTDTFCSTGTASSTPSFPASASSVSWTCTGAYGGGNASCMASRSAPIIGAYRKQITVSNSSGSSLTNYQVKLAVAYDSDMRSDFNDLRFTSSDGATLLGYWVESYTASTSATVWVKIPSIPTSGTTIYMYYGTQTASASSGSNTFAFFDDFEYTDTPANHGWTIKAGSFGSTFNSSSAYAKRGTYSMKMYPGETASASLNYVLAASNSQIALDMDYYETDATETSIYTGLSTYFTNSGIDGAPWVYDNTNYKICAGNNCSSWTTTSRARSNGWHKYSSQLGNGTSSYYIDDVLLSSYSNARSATEYAIWSGSPNGGWGNTRYYDTVRIRNFISPEPAGSFGSEETGA